MIDSIDPAVAAVLISLVSIVLAILTERDRRRGRRARDRAEDNPWACGLVWVVGSTWCVCTRPNEHTGPHLDGVHQVMHR